ncbi:unnamed protein product, partial [Mesorhabditis spiculigera]
MRHSPMSMSNGPSSDDSCYPGWFARTLGSGYPTRLHAGHFQPRQGETAAKEFRGNIIHLEKQQRANEEHETRSSVAHPSSLANQPPAVIGYPPSHTTVDVYDYPHQYGDKNPVLHNCKLCKEGWKEKRMYYKSGWTAYFTFLLVFPLLSAVDFLGSSTDGSYQSQLSAERHTTWVLVLGFFGLNVFGTCFGLWGIWRSKKLAVLVLGLLYFNCLLFFADNAVSEWSRGDFRAENQRFRVVFH